MGLASSTSAGSPQTIQLHELRSWIERELEKRYRRGMHGVVSNLTPVLADFLTLQGMAIEMGVIVSEKMSALQSKEAGKEQSKDSHLTPCKALIDSIVLTVEGIGRDFPVLLDYSTLRTILKTLREGFNVIRQSSSSLSEIRNQEISSRLSPTLQNFTTTQEQLREALDDLEEQVEESKPFTQHIEHARGRLLSGLSETIEELALLPQSLKARREYEEASRRLEGTRAAAYAATSSPLLQEGREVEAEARALTHRMNDMLAPFIRITQNIKGKEGRISESGLSPSEVETVQKYTSVLLQPDLYERLVAEGEQAHTHGIEEFLEAIFLLGIAGGVGDEAAAKQSVLSRKSQALLANALNSFNADSFRGCFEAWRLLHFRLSSMMGKEEYKAQQKASAERGAAYEEAAKALDRSTKEWQRFAATYERGVA
eukprot:CAMPEP_0181313272 /NCGR_PEP_ID=MMETSP1101-20121128/14160_1 /TAXON_ID=46948 /ORGANISM="Rhodomonas abbreviata, Strain Caron Lab Isolate" /LENGTH=427 /DNA_ID=CAMNT_0023420215 /DNA_START=198 /DNA_END=1477 /DNA_ORIENTATION=+